MLHSYFSKHTQFSPTILLKPKNDLGIVVVIPSYNEPNLRQSIKSLADCQLPHCAVEVLVVVNYPENSSGDVVSNAKECIDHVQRLNAELSNPKFQLITIDAKNLPKKHAGVGLARKIGMDEAAWRLLESENKYKIIACFDADATCSNNYLVELENLWIKFTDTEACSIRYAHPIEGAEFDDFIYNAIAQYELHLRYYVQAGKFVGHPFSYHTVGSSMACSAKAYIRYGGMNRNKAGEDFYFLQKIIPHGNFRELNTTCIFPSPRPSYRVPFGTGRAMTKFIENSENIYQTYNLNSWLGLKPFFENSGKLFCASRTSADDYLLNQDKSLQDFLQINNFYHAIEEINANTSTPESFQKRFFQWFDAFLMLKYMNFASENFYIRQPILGEAQKLAKLMGINSKASTAKDLLIEFREWETEFSPCSD
jgi:glycosyltransferase involved in cell wall biosynthesis